MDPSGYQASATKSARRTNLRIGAETYGRLLAVQK